VIGLAAAGGAMAGGRPFSTDLTGAAERPNPGDPDGSGSAWVSLNPGTGEVCYEYSVSGVANLTAAHIHRGSADVAGPVVIPLPPTSATGGSGCVTAGRTLIMEIIRDPSAFYVNVHNADFPPGALRGQLSR
jgi:hypothetical protein